MALSLTNGWATFLLFPALLLLLLSSSFRSADSGGVLPAASYRTETAAIKGACAEWISARRLIAEDMVPTPVVSPVPNTSFKLAAERTRRKDPLENYNHYTEGWNISNEHYWASVGFTAVPFFLVGIIWFLGFGLTLLLISFYCCCCRRRTYSYSQTAYALSLILLIFFTCVAIIGCAVLYTGQGKFHGNTSDTLDYIVDQANYTVENLMNFSDSLSAAKKVSVDMTFLPEEVLKKIDAIETKINSSANDLAFRTKDNAKKINDILDYVILDLIIIAAVMLLMAFLGFVFSILGWQLLVYILVLIGWVLVAGTFILSGVFLLFHNVVADTCVAMDDWVQHPHAHTSMDDILPCVDVATANESYYRSREVTFQMVNVVNDYLVNVSNRNLPPALAPLYFNQSGPPVPLLCNPLASDLTDRPCSAGEVHFGNATQVWKSYVCDVTAAAGSEVCTTAGRIKPSTYGQMTAAASVGYGTYRYGPFLVQLQDCTFVRDTFTTVRDEDCPGLRLHSRWIYIGLAMVSAAVMLSAIFWVVYARERRHRRHSKQFLVSSTSQVPPLQEKTP